MLVTSLFYLLFLVYNESSGVLVSLFSIAAAFSTAVTLYLIFYIVIRPFAVYKRTTLAVACMLCILTNLALVVDFFIFRIWKFHINAMVLNILFSPSAYDSIQTGIMPIITAIAIIMGLVIIEFFLVKKLLSLQESTTQQINRSFNRIALPALVMLILGEKLTYGFANMYGHQNVLESTRPIPLYQPLDFTRDMERVFGLKAPGRDTTSLAVDANRQVHYPLEDLQIQGSERPHVFWIVIDSLRYDMLRDDIMPNTVDLIEESWIFTQNISGGNTTRFGIFSLFYGINSSYWFSFLNAQKGSVLFDVLNKLNYNIRIVSSTDTRWPEFQKTAFFSVTDRILDNYVGTQYEKDRQSSSDFIDWIRTADTSQPMFGFLFLDAPHGASYPEDFSKFKPDNYGELNYLTVSKDVREPMLNQYKNSIHYNDYLLSEVYTAIRKKGIDENSMIIITADHGQEFYEYGLYGHNSAYNRAQVQVPLLIRWPHKEARRIDTLTASMDIVPTLLTYLGVSAAPSRYSNGYDLASPDYQRDYAFVGNWYENAIITQEHIFVFDNSPDSLFSTRVYDIDGYKLQDSYDKRMMQTLILQVLAQNSWFIQ